MANDIVFKPFFIDEEGFICNDLIEIAKRQRNLTFDTNYLKRIATKYSTPFKEIKRYEPHVNYQQIMDERLLNYAQLLNDILITYKAELRLLKPSEKYLFSCSCGTDSRIITGLLAQLRDEEGMSLDNIVFHCWGSPEADEFKRLTERFGITNLSFFDDSVPDCYDIGNLDISTNGWYPLTAQMKFWLPQNPAEYIHLTGADGEVFRDDYTHYLNMPLFLNNMGEVYREHKKIFKDIFVPCLRKNVYRMAFSIPSCWKGNTDAAKLDKRLGRDKLRTDLCEKLGALDLPISTNPQRFKFNISAERVRYMKYVYESSRFFKDFRWPVNPENLYNPWSHDSIVWGFAATVYERIYR